MNKLFNILAIFLICLSCSSNQKLTERKNPFHIAFVMGDEEYRSEESMPMLAEILKRELGAEISLCYAMDENGYVKPNRNDHIDNLHTLANADLVVFFTRFRALPDNQLKMITDYVESGKPIVGFRTSTHMFL
ncbi:MAG: hypothetical protein RLZZ546_681, partial [Bacteroidota bacterium]